MKKTAIIAAAASLTAISVPAHAAEIQAPSSQFLTSSAQFGSVASSGLALTETSHLAEDRKRKGKKRKGKNRSKYDNNGRYVNPRQVRRGDNVWRGRDGRYYCKRDNGTTGLIIGAAGGALVGRTVDTQGDRTAGTLVGGALGALLGREIDRGSARCR